MSEIKPKCSHINGYATTGIILLMKLGLDEIMFLIPKQRAARQKISCYQ